MIVLPQVKLGTHPYGCAKVRGKKSFPKVGDIIYIRENRDDKNIYDNPWIKVKVDKVKGNEVWFVSKHY